MAVSEATWRLVADEEAVEIKPPVVVKSPVEVTERTFVLPAFWISKTSAVAALNARSARAVAEVEVASSVATVSPPKSVVVPIPSWSEIVVKRITVPVSVNPPPEEVLVAAQTGSPFETASTWPEEPMPRLVKTLLADA